MAEAEPGTGGFFESARRVGSSLLGLLRTRVELLAVELQEEKLRTMGLLVWLVVAVTLGVAGLLVAIGLLSVFLWERAGYAGVIGLAAVTLALAVVMLWIIRRRILHGPTPFAGTIAEVEKDIACLRKRD